MDVVQLDVLPGGDVQDAVGVLLGDLRERVELIGADATERILMRCMPGASQAVPTPLVRAAFGKAICWVVMPS